MVRLLGPNGFDGRSRRACFVEAVRASVAAIAAPECADELLNVHPMEKDCAEDEVGVDDAG